MSKKELGKYLKSLTRKQLEEQVFDLYDRFKEVKVFYDFTFNPKEEKLLNQAKTKIYKEYFPQGARKPKTRRSVAQKLITHYTSLGLDPGLLIDIMLFNIETAQSYSEIKPFKQEVFYRSMFKSFEQALSFALIHRLTKIFEERFINIAKFAEVQGWQNDSEFSRILAESEITA